MSKKLSIEDIVADYKSIDLILVQFRREIVNQLEKLIEENEIRLGFPIQSRVKQIDSICEKHKSGIVNITKSVTQLQDLVGLRIIVLFNRDIEDIISLLDKRLKIIKKYNTNDRLGDDQFGYSSIHCIAKIPDAWLEVPLFTGCGGFNIEIQIRTLSQHNWAELSHLLVYKSREDLPKPLKRSLSRVSALLETVDLEFERLLDAKEAFETSSKKEEEAKILTQENLIEILKISFPQQFNHNNENYNFLVDKLFELGYQKTTDIQLLIEKYLDQAIDLDKMICGAIITDNGASEIVNINGKEYATSRIEEIKKGMSFHNLVSCLSLLIRTKKEKEIIEDI